MKWDSRQDKFSGGTEDEDHHFEPHANSRYAEVRKGFSTIFDLAS